MQPLLHGVLDELADVVERIDDDQLSAPTPCTELDVAALREHVVGWATSFATGAADPQGRTPDVGDHRATGDPAGELREAAERFDRGIADGAADRPLWIGENSMPGEMALDMILWEYLVHGWDLARATDRPWSPAPEAAQRALGFAPGMLTPTTRDRGNRSRTRSG